MGLDVYLYRYTGDRTYDEDNQELEEHSDALENFWHEIRIEVAGEPVKIMKETPFGVKETEKKLTSEQYKEIRRIERIRQSHYIEQNNLHLTLGDYGAEISEEQTEIDSEKYPDHMFKIGYMRSSYNSGGFNSVVKKIVGHDLYWLFGVEDVQEYVVRPDWKTALIRCDMLLDQLGMDQGYNIIRIPTDNILSPDFIRVGEPTDERNSLKKFMGIMEDDTINDEDGFIIDGFQMLPKGKCLLAVVNTQDGYGIVLKGEDGEPYVFHPKNKSVADTSLAVFQLKMYDRKKQQRRKSCMGYVII